MHPSQTTSGYVIPSDPSPNHLPLRTAHQKVHPELKYFRENIPNEGHLQISPQFGIIGFPGAGYCSAAQAALEALSESLSQEIDPEWNIKITVIEPGPFRTKALKCYLSAASSSLYKRESAR